MKNYISLTLLLIAGNVFSQVPGNICLGTDATVCIGSTVTIEDCNPGNGAGNYISLTNNSILHTLSDDVYSNVVNIGFPFSFYGNTYNQCVIGSNGVITFDLSKAGAYCPWSLGAVAPLPNSAFGDALNTQMPAYQDMNPSAFASPVGEVRSETIGVAPNRRFIILFKDIIAFGAQAGECNYIAVIMNESTNSFEFHLGSKPVVASWNSGLAIQGSQNITGTVAHITPGRNNSVWTAFQEAKIWTPTTPANTANYAISNIPYMTIISPTSTFAWGNTLNNTTQPYNNGILVVNPVLPGTTGYFLTAAATGCGPIGGASDTTFITGVSSSVVATGIDDICSAGIGSVTATPTSGSPPYTFLWPTLGNATTQTVSNVTAGTYQVQMIDAMGCGSNAMVTIGDTPASYNSSTTIISCPGGNDGTAFVEMIPPLGNITYLWDDPMAQTTQTAVGLTAGTYNCVITSDIGCSNTLTVIITEIPGMTGVIIAQSDVTCNSGNDGMIEVNVIQGTPPYTYSWDNSTSTQSIATDLVVGAHTVTVTDANGCTITITGNLGEPTPLSIVNITPDTQICPEDKIILTAAGAGGSSPYKYTWFQGGIEIGIGDNIEVDPDVTNTNYCVELTEECGSPSIQACVLVYFPTPIEPLASPDMTAKCVPDTFFFSNISTNGLEVASTFWEFGDNITHVDISTGLNPVEHYYTTTGPQDITMTVTSIFGCVYVDTMKSLIEVVPSPTANWNFSSNPSTIFETTVQMFDKSVTGIVDWQWYSPGSQPTSSNLQNPIFQFPEDVVKDYPVTLIVTNQQGCLDTLTMYVSIVEDILFYAPTAFTPDGNELNNTWRPIVTGIDIYDYDLFVYNRWGELIWESHDPSQGWDGTYKGRIIKNDTYIWTATVKNPYADERINFSGHVSILKGEQNFVTE
ncbi:MAG: gliding motility-associated C-terminal domain-containing protein [Fluviicola sp.]|nr:gliding motility-associated C-terminal domain-containing protein [Fluviicola sp.]